MAHRFRKSAGPTRLGKKARASMRWSLEANLVMLGAVAAIAIALSLLLLVLPTSELHAQTNSAPSVSRVSPSSPVSLTTGGSQTFQVSATDADNNLTKWEWEVDKHLSFLHGHQEPEETFIATGSITKSFSHTFPDNGTYTVTVTFTDSDGESGTAEWRADVEDPPNRPPLVSRVSPYGIPYMATGDVTFTASASDPDDNLKSYEWFVDDTSEDDGSWLILPTGAVTRTFTHNFSTAGEYTVKVTFTDDEGLSASVSWTVTAVEPITVQLGADNYTVNEDDGEAEIAVTISASPPEFVSVIFRTYDGEAESRRDFVHKAIIVTFSPDTSLTQTVPVYVIDNNIVEGTEAFTVALETYTFIPLPTYVSLTRSEATVKILDDDEATVAFTENMLSFSEDQGTFEIGVEVETDPSSFCEVALPFDVHFSYTDPDGALSSSSTIPSSMTFGICDSRRVFLADLADVTGNAEVVFTLDSVTSADSGLASRVKIGEPSTVTLTVIDDSSPPPPSNRAPTVSRVSPTSSSLTLETGASQTFTASATDADSNITSYAWTVNGLGVGNSGSLALTGEVSQTFTHTFSSSGTHTVKATFTDDEGASGSASWTVGVIPPVQNNGPSVERVSPTSQSLTLTTGQKRTFTARAIDPDNKLKRYEWFVNSVSKGSHTWLLVLPRGAVTEEFAHRFLTYGSHTVTATFTNADGQSGSVSWDVEVTGPDLTSWVGTKLTGSKTVYGTCEVSPNEVQAGDQVTLTATVTSDNLTGNVYLSPAFTETTRGIVSPEDLHLSLKTESQSISEGGTVTLTQKLAAAHAGDYDLSCRLFWEWPGALSDVKLEDQQQSSTPLAVGGGGNFSGSGRSALSECGPVPKDMLLLPLLAGENVTLAATGSWGSGDDAGFYSARAYVYHGGDVVANDFGAEQFNDFTGSLPIFSGTYSFDPLGEYVMDCELYYHLAMPSNPFASTTEKLKTGFMALYSPGSAIGGIAGFRGVLTTTFTIADARWGDQQLSIITGPPGDTGGATLPYGGGTVTVQVHTQESMTRQTGVPAPTISIEDLSISERAGPCATGESEIAGYTQRCWQTTLEVPENDLVEVKSYTVTASSDHINGTRHGTFVVEALPVDKPVLDTFYEDTDGPNWDDDTDWLSHAPLDDWRGVDTADGRVTVLELPSNGLSGAIPTVVGDLTGLEVLDLSGNGLTGEIPAALESLTALGTLDLSGNGLRGEIPSDLGDLTALTTLDLSYNDLDGGIPSALGRLIRLEVLRLYDNDLNRPIPSELGNLTKLTELDLSGNGLSGSIPAELDKLANLQVLDLSGNRLRGAIPEGLGNLEQLDDVYLDGNSLDRGCIPATWRDLRNHDLDDIDLPFCDVALSALAVSPGELTPGFDPGVSEYTARVEDGQVTITPATSHGGAFQLLDGQGVSVPDADGALGGHQIAVGYGDTTIKIRVVSPDGGDRYTYTVRVVWAGEPRVPAIAGITPGPSSLEVSWVMPTDIRDDYITSYGLRHIQSSAPDQADGNWTVLDNVWTSGPLSHTVNGLLAGTGYDVQLRAVTSAGDSPWSAAVSGTPAEGECSTEGAVSDPANNPGQAADCEVLLEVRDALSGGGDLDWEPSDPVSGWDGAEVDPATGRITRLDLDGAGQTGVAPSGQARLTRQQTPASAKDRLTGEIPATLSSLTDLEYLSLARNQLTGGIPGELARLTELQALRLQGNLLTGQIPAELAGLSNLVELKLGQNRLTGCVPEGLLDVADNDLDQLGLPACGPAVVMSVATTSIAVRIGTPIAVTAGFDEPVTGFTAGGVSVVNGSAGSFSGSDGDTVYTFAVVPDAIGAVTVDIAAGVAEDSGGNGNRAAPRLWLGMPYDDDGDGAIEKNEVIAAINDYLFGEGDEAISKSDVIKLINLYLFG